MNWIVQMLLHRQRQCLRIIGVLENAVSSLNLRNIVRAIRLLALRLPTVRRVEELALQGMSRRANSMVLELGMSVEEYQLANGYLSASTGLISPGELATIHLDELIPLCRALCKCLRVRFEHVRKFVLPHVAMMLTETDQRTIAAKIGFKSTGVIRKTHGSLSNSTS